ncbi:Protein NRT1/ PTR FAMILY 4.6 [Hibiscus syriacus]|uniref:Protein NRT1/ PTR FAMILY 4.6 n=1 Tax=Hibiscus syriacus TaxID=106335 RepID=A0A6A3BH97_HIBSY|nr:Protein NRT1/ PTR FAMILY 4.6 [Hibiscus syriacus]
MTVGDSGGDGNISYVGCWWNKRFTSPHGAEQFDDTTPQGRKQRSSFFNYFVFCLSCGGLIAVTIVVLIEDNKGWQWGFGVATAAILTSIPVFLLGSPIYRTKIPAGSPITTMFKVEIGRIIKTTKALQVAKSYSLIKPFFIIHVQEVLVAAIYNNCKSKNPSNAIMGMETSPSSYGMKPVKKRMTPSCCLSQLSNFCVQQAATMNTKIGSLKVPPASLAIFPVVFVMIIALTYNHVTVPFARKVTKTEMGITHPQKIGTGLILSIIAMAMAALVEIKRKNVAVESGLLDSAEPLPITFLWIALHYLFLRSADLFTLAGMMEFFFTEAPTSMRSLATSLSWASLSMGYYFSSVLHRSSTILKASFDTHRGFPVAT